MKHKLYIIPNAHLDPVWLWHWQDGCNEVMQTFRSAVDRLNEYENLTFNCSSGEYYRWVEELDPTLFDEIDEKVKEGRWNITGGWAVQPDCNMPSCESFARHALYNQLYFYEKFGKICRTGYCVDSFGHSGNLPQILNKSGMYTYMFMRPGYDENPEIPDGPFYWKCKNNSARVLAFHIYESYGESGRKNLDVKSEMICKLSEEKDIPLALFFGVGNHGGGPTKGDTEYLTDKFNMNDEDNSSAKFATTDEYFHDLCESLSDLPVYCGELKHHASGCYSVTSFVKQMNRTSENLLYRAEVWNTLSSRLTGSSENNEILHDAWNKVLFNQFHDILCGCSIKEAYESVKADNGYAVSVAEKIMNNAVLRISRRINTWIDGISEPYTGEIRHCGMPEGFPRIVTVFNALSFAVKVPVRTYYQTDSVKNSKGDSVPFSLVRSSRSNDSHIDTVFLAEIPPFGYETFFLSNCDIDYHKILKPIGTKGNILIENEYIKAEFDAKTGYICSLVSMKNGREYAQNPLDVPIVVSDSKTDTWAHNVFSFEEDLGKMKLEKIELVENNDMRKVVRATHIFRKSNITREYILAKEQKTLRVKCKSLWQEKFTVLKLSFDIGGENAVDTAEIAGGYEIRNACGDEENMQKWAAVVSEKNGVKSGLAVLNDSKYSYSCKDSELRITALRNVIFADHYSDRPYGEFNFTDEGLNCFEYGIYLFDGDVEKSDVSKEAAMFNIRPYVVCESCHKGDLPQTMSNIRINKKNVIVTALKYCEDGSGDIVVRLYETDGEKETRCMLMSDLLDVGFWFDITAGEIKTFRICKNGIVRHVDFMEGIIPPNEKIE